ncbi:MAG: NAD(P)/FAD-dependent oxidoreductase [Selenomonadaceae bacterium]|nr:NAD(P)/FAD-dependent oxidoreductase [Selenomonadaceae bacterium]
MKGDELNLQRVIIIGAGPAGLTAAYELSKFPDKFKVIVLEESSSLGGISRTVEHNGNLMDMGPHRFFTKVKEVEDWWKKLMPLADVSSPDEKILLKKNRFTRIFFRGKFYDYPVKMNATTFENLGLGETLKVGMSYFKSLLFKRKENSLEDFFINRFGKKLYSMFFEGYTEKVWGRHPRDISTEWGSQRVKGLSGVAVLKNMIYKALNITPKKIETSLADSFYYPKRGSGQLWEIAAEAAEKNGAEIIMQAKATKIHRATDNSISGVVYEQFGKEFELPCDILLSSMPLKDLVAGMENVPENIQKIAEGLPYRDYMTIGILVPRLNVTVPDHWVYVQGDDVKMGRFLVFNNWSPSMLKDPNTIWLALEYFCQEGDEMWTSPDEKFAAFAIDEMIRKNLISSADAVKDYHIERVKKAYPSYFDTYAQIDELKTYLDTSTNLYCIGRNGQHRYNNIDHSMCTSFEAVKNILSGTKDKSNVWIVNTEEIRRCFHSRKVV